MGGDGETLAERLDYPGLIPVTAMLLADGGAAALNPLQWIEKLRPQVLEALKGYNLLRTDHNGWIELTTDGEQLWVEVERQ